MSVVMTWKNSIFAPPLCKPINFNPVQAPGFAPTIENFRQCVCAYANQPPSVDDCASGETCSGSQHPRYWEISFPAVSAGEVLVADGDPCADFCSLLEGDYTFDACCGTSCGKSVFLNQWPNNMQNDLYCTDPEWLSTFGSSWTAVYVVQSMGFFLSFGNITPRFNVVITIYYSSNTTSEVRTGQHSALWHGASGLRDCNDPITLNFTSEFANVGSGFGGKKICSGWPSTLTATPLTSS